MALNQATCAQHRHHTLAVAQLLRVFLGKRQPARAAWGDAERCAPGLLGLVSLPGLPGVRLHVTEVTVILYKRRRLEHNRLQLDNVTGLHRARDGARMSMLGALLMF